MKGFYKKRIINHTTCWEDPHIIQKALKINKNDTILSVTSAGDNVLNFLLYDPKMVISVDKNPIQNQLFELKIEAVRHLKYEEFLELIGITSSNKREKFYNKIKDYLQRETQIFWDSNIELIKKGIIYNGFQERYLSFLGKYLRFLKGEKTIKNIFKCYKKDEQTNYFYRYIYGYPWRYYLLFSNYTDIVKTRHHYRMLLEFANKKNKPFKDIKQILSNIWYTQQMEYVFTKVPIKNNYFLSLLLLGHYLDKNYFPPYLYRANFSIIREKLNRIKIQYSSFEQILKELNSDSITKFNLSNIFDWSNYEEILVQLKEISRVGKNRARMCYFSTRNDREIPNNIKFIKPEKQLITQLSKENRVFGYQKFEVGFICK